MNHEHKRKPRDARYDAARTGEEALTCSVCGRAVLAAGAGSAHRNHCPHCLSGVHLDDEPGDRAADCGGRMDPVAVWVRRNGKWANIHRCRRCGVLHSNRIAADDDPLKLMSMALQSLAWPPFPLERLQALAEAPEYER